MKSQILFSGNNKKNIINLLSAEFAQRRLKVNVLIINPKILKHLFESLLIYQQYTNKLQTE